MVEQVNQGLVAVAQCDREAAAALVEHDLLSGHSVWLPNVPRMIRNGRGDHWAVVQSFARHRLAERERCAQIAEDRVPAVQCMSVEPIVSACTDIATAIRSSSEGPKHDR